MRKRYPFLTYERLKDTIRGKALLIFIVSLCFSLLPSPWLKMPRWPWVLMALASFSLAALTSLISRSSYVKLAAEGLEIKSLFGEIFIPYDEIVETYYGVFGKIFEPAHQNWSQRIFLQPFWFEPVIVLKLEEFPYDYASLRLLFGKYLFEPRKKILVLLVKEPTELNARISSILQERRLQKTEEKG
ncbi:MAG: hypothetical protein RMK30_07415 [Anaerolineae bacterium]|nr:hypothetical protein [Anaerolineae bacterium]MDW8102686.1 hypothetical protein [Anaerolineae bacterium]